MLSKNKAKFIRALHDKKERYELKLFLVEWAKSLQELLKSTYEIEFLVVSEDFAVKNRVNLSHITHEIASEEEITKISTLQSNTDGIAVVKQKKSNDLQNSWKEIILVLDEIKDPGNLGTIIRIADWYGITKIIASKNTVEFYNPKVIISTMGSFSRVEMQYCDLNIYIKKQTLPIYGAFMNGEDIHTIPSPAWCFLVIGNESNGISKEIESLVTKKITIPKYGQAESLNAGIATAIILDNFKRDK